VSIDVAMLVALIVWQPLLLLLHELGHALAALALTRGEVRIDLARGPFVGVCEYDPSEPRVAHAEAWVAAAGPAVSLAAAAVLWIATLGSSEWTVGTWIVFAGAISASLQFAITALPIRYGAGLDDAGADSDGRAVWRILTGAPPGGLAREAQRMGRRDPAIRPAFAVVLVAIVVATAFLSLAFAAILVALVGVAFVLQRR
jgi:hypothetical protein